MGELDWPWYRLLFRMIRMLGPQMPYVGLALLAALVLLSHISAFPKLTRAKVESGMNMLANVYMGTTLGVITGSPPPYFMSTEE